MQPKNTRRIGLGLVLLVVTSLLVSAPALARTQEQRGVPARPATAPVAVPGVVDTETFNLCASAGSVTMPDSSVITIWGFSQDTGSGCPAAQLPGPVLQVDEGDTVVVNLTNNLAENVSIVFPGQNLVPDMVGAAGSGGTTSYTFTASSPGTYLYESGTNTSVQVAMGLYGALVVRPLCPTPPCQAYAGANSTYDEEAILVLSEIDPALNAAPGTFNMLDYAPSYWLINGQAYPGTSSIPVQAGDRLLVRYLNAGLTHHTMLLLGQRQRVIAKDAYPLNFPFDAVSETIASGQTADMIVTVPAGTAVGTSFPLYSRSLYLTNGPVVGDGTIAPHAPGGMQTRINVTP